MRNALLGNPDSSKTAALNYNTKLCRLSPEPHDCSASMSLEASGQLERLMRSGLRHCESFAVLDAHAAGEIEPVAIQRIGPDLVFARLWKESGIADVLHSY